MFMPLHPIIVYKQNRGWNDTPQWGLSFAMHWEEYSLNLILQGSGVKNKLHGFLCFTTSFYSLNLKS